MDAMGGEPGRLKLHDGEQARRHRVLCNRGHGSLRQHIMTAFQPHRKYAKSNGTSVAIVQTSTIQPPRILCTVRIRSRWTSRTNTRDNEVVPIVPSAFVHQERIDTGVTKASRALALEVVRIRYTLGEDWSGSAAVSSAWSFRTMPAGKIICALQPGALPLPC
jgi:hypothetical protein